MVIDLLVILSQVTPLLCSVGGDESAGDSAWSFGGNESFRDFA